MSPNHPHPAGPPAPSRPVVKRKRTGGISALSKRSPPSPTRQALPLAAHPLQHTLPRVFPKSLQTPSPALPPLPPLPPLPRPLQGPGTTLIKRCSATPPNPAPFLATNNKPASTQRVSNSCPTLTLPVRDNSSTKQASKRYPTGQPQIFLLFFTAKSTFRPQLPRQNHQYQQHPGHQTRRIPSRLSFRHQRLGLMTDNPTGTNNSDPLCRSLRCEHVG